MDDLVLTRKVSGGGLVLPPREQTDIFLCHNSRDKPVVRQVAEGLELEFGLPHFLDAYAIPTGEAFLPWIERALATSSGCAVSVSSRHLEPQSVVANDCVHQEVRWTRWRRRGRYCGDGTVRS